MGLVVSFGDDVEEYGWEEKEAEVEENPIEEVEEVAKLEKVVEDVVEEKEVITQEKSPVVIPQKKMKNKKKTSVPVIKKEKKKLPKKESVNKKNQEDTDNFMKNVFQRNNEKKNKVKKTEKAGNPVGKGNSNGHAWSLSGRGLVGSIVSPNYTSNVEGKITVAIRVDRIGNVTNASISSPTTISDKATRDAAVKAARKTHFSKGEGVSIGTITYNFRLQ